MAESGDEARWVAAACAGDREAFEALVRAHARTVASMVSLHVRPDEVADLTQEIWAAVWRKLWQLEREDRLLPWLRVVVFYHCLNHRKAARAREAREVTLDADEWLRIGAFARDPDASPADVLAARELRRGVAVELRALPPVYGEILRLRYIAGLAEREVAEHTGFPLSTVKWRLHVARRLLRGRLASLFREWRGSD